jgi:aryl-alcohol dehydrogenase-like predicted oxidoreductase
MQYARLGNTGTFVSRICLGAMTFGGTANPVSDAIGRLTRGKVRYIGCSNHAAWQIVKALGISAHEHIARYVTVQAYYSLVGRDLEEEIVPAALDQGLGLLCWSPLAGGLLSGKFDRHGATEKGSRREMRGASAQFPPVDEDRAFAIIDVLREIAARTGASPSQIALAWLLAQPAVTSVITG